MNQEIIELLEKAKCYAAPKAEEYINQALAKLRTEQPPAKIRCRGKKTIYPEAVEQDDCSADHYPKPYPCPGCPDCTEQINIQERIDYETDKKKSD